MQNLVEFCSLEWYVTCRNLMQYFQFLGNHFYGGIYNHFRLKKFCIFSWYDAINEACHRTVNYTDIGNYIIPYVPLIFGHSNVCLQWISCGKGLLCWQQVTRGHVFISFFFLHSHSHFRQCHLYLSFLSCVSYSTASETFLFVSFRGDNLSRWLYPLSRSTVSLSRWRILRQRDR